MRSFIPLLKTEWRLLLFGFLMTFASSLGQTYFISLFSGEIRQDLGLSHSDFGAIYSAATLTSAVILLWSGTLIDRIELRRFSYTTVVGLALGCLVLAFSHTVGMLFLAILLLRHLGQGLMYMAATTSMVRYLDAQKGKANAISGMGYSLSEALLPSLVVVLILWVGWRESWLIWATLLVLSMPLLIHWLLQNQAQRHQQYLQSLQQAETASQQSSTSLKPRRKQWTRAEVLCDPLLYLFLPGLMGQPLLFTGYIFHQIHIIEDKGWSMPFWSSLFIMYAIVTIVVKLSSGVLVDRFGAIRLVPILMLPMAAGLLYISTTDHWSAAVIFMLGMGITVGAYATTSAPFFSEMYGNQHLGAIKSLATAAMVFMSALSPVLLGWLIDVGINMDKLFLSGVVYILLTSLLAWWAYLQVQKRNHTV